MPLFHIRVATTWSAVPHTKYMEDTRILYLVLCSLFQSVCWHVILVRGVQNDPNQETLKKVTSSRIQIIIIIVIHKDRGLQLTFHSDTFKSSVFSNSLQHSPQFQ